MRYCTFEHQGRRAPGRIEGHRVVDLSDGGRLNDLGAYLAAADSPFAGPTVALDAVRLVAPIPRPPKVVAVGLNYADHAHEQAKTPPIYPMFFAKARTCVIGPGESILLPEGRDCIDVEVELAVVFGRAGRNVSAERALDHVFGFTILNDVSDRKAQKDDRQYYRAKSWPTFAPTGPVVVTPDEFDHRQAAISLIRSGRVQQASNTGQLIFDVPTLIELLSSFQDLEPGDILSTGTPSGVGAHRHPPAYLADGDTVECRIEGIGALMNPVRAG